MKKGTVPGDNRKLRKRVWIVIGTKFPGLDRALESTTKRRAQTVRGVRDRICHHGV